VAGERVLVVDDNPTNAKLLGFVLKKEGYEYRIAADAEIALEMIPEFQPRLLLLDLQLPGMDGLTLARHLRAQHKDRSLVIVAVTANAMVGDEQEALASGCDAFISKPIDTRGLPLRIAELLR
jgi:CheY-like chemotaxis protein